jgi:hypothetical protein
MYVQSEQGSYDTGETSRVRRSIQEMMKKAPLGAEIWFCDNAHMKRGQLTTTTSQMLFDYVQASLLGVDNYGWFMHDIFHVTNETYYTGNQITPDSFSRYPFITDTLIPLTKSALFEESRKILKLEEQLGELQTRLEELELLVIEPRISIPAMLLISLIIMTSQRRRAPH